jgi:hypothetical protein
MAIKIAQVKKNHIKNPITMANALAECRAGCKTMLHSTSDNWECASERAHKRRYDAVFDIPFNVNSIVWII